MSTIHTESTWFCQSCKLCMLHIHLYTNSGSIEKHQNQLGTYFESSSGAMASTTKNRSVCEHSGCKGIVRCFLPLHLPHLLVYEKLSQYLTSVIRECCIGLPWLLCACIIYPDSASNWRTLKTRCAINSCVIALTTMITGIATTSAASCCSS